MKFATKNKERKNNIDELQRYHFNLCKRKIINCKFNKCKRDNLLKYLCAMWTKKL